jgi:hypothetical protein
LFDAGSLRKLNKFVIFILIFILGIVPLYSQDINYAKSIVKTLSSPEYHGRGYVKNGDNKAAKFIIKQLKSFNIQPFNNSYLQSYTFHITTFPGKMEVSIDGKSLAPGSDFVVFPASAAINGTFDIVNIDSTLFSNDFTIQKFGKTNFTNKFVFVDTTGWGKDIIKKTVLDLIMAVDNPFRIKGFGLVQKELMWWVLTYQAPNCGIFVKKGAYSVNPKSITLKIDSKLASHKANNVIGYIPGQIDSFIVYTAHFDHLGRMGKSIYYPGANDNASGTAMVLDFAREYASKNLKPKYNTVFLFFSGEEVGLFGSQHFLKNPVFPIQKIKFLVNLDMEGTGKDGVMVKNGSIYPREYSKIDSLNKALNLNLPLIPRGVSRGSDHYPFHQKGVFTMFINTEDKSHPYHSPDDRYEKLPFTVYEPLFKLINAYINTF